MPRLLVQLGLLAAVSALVVLLLLPAKRLASALLLRRAARPAARQQGGGPGAQRASPSSEEAAAPGPSGQGLRHRHRPGGASGHVPAAPAGHDAAQHRPPMATATSSSSRPADPQHHQHQPSPAAAVASSMQQRPCLAPLSIPSEPAHASPFAAAAGPASLLPAQPPAGEASSTDGDSSQQLAQRAGSSSSAGSRAQPAALVTPPTTPRRQALQRPSFDLSPVLQAGAARRAQSRPRGGGDAPELGRASFDGSSAASHSGSAAAAGRPAGSSRSAPPSPMNSRRLPWSQGRGDDQQLQQLRGATSSRWGAAGPLHRAAAAGAPGAGSPAACSSPSGRGLSHGSAGPTCSSSSSSSSALHPEELSSSHSAPVKLPLRQLMERPGSLQTVIEQAAGRWQQLDPGAAGTAAGAAAEQSRATCEGEWSLFGSEALQRYLAALSTGSVSSLGNAGSAAPAASSSRWPNSSAAAPTAAASSPAGSSLPSQAGAGAAGLAAAGGAASAGTADGSSGTQGPLHHGSPSPPPSSLYPGGSTTRVLTIQVGAGADRALHCCSLLVSGRTLLPVPSNRALELNGRLCAKQGARHQGLTRHTRSLCRSSLTRTPCSWTSRGSG
jgi:hypothetical protein